MAESGDHDDSPGDARLVAWGDELIRLHDGFRRDLAAIRHEAQRALDGRGSGAPPTRMGLALELRSHCLTFCEQLHLHHSGEDEVLFPHLGREYPQLAAVLERLGREHRVVARLLDDIRAVFAELTDDADLTPERAGRLATDLDRLTSELEAHLDYEEEQLVPLLNSMTTMPDGV